ncbi:uncharacterized protein LOC118426734 [Branchiostoma floridae]|uniref:Uncharacterized protein LOC118426734 n=1 Tax=Branchiostoma floridae TaxID=7739 RepID=A0A9J7N6V5_BRAFL|nr:uncharacterized protein LOC118426734 [Branchiostoma floridae]
MATRWMWVCVVSLTLIELGSSDPMFTFVQDRLSKKEQESVINLFKKHWKPGVPDTAFEEYLTRIVYLPSVLKDELPSRIVDLLRSLDNVERLELVREVRELMDYKEEHQEDTKIGRGLKAEKEEIMTKKAKNKVKKKDTDEEHSSVGGGLKEEEDKIKKEQQLLASLKARKKQKKQEG